MKKTLIALALAGLCSLPLTANAETSDDYVMRPGDQLQITVFGHEDLGSAEKNSYIVRPDGKFSFPLIGLIDVNNKNVEQCTDELASRLAEYLLKPQVSVNITKLGTTRVYVLGEIKSPGLYELEKSHNVLDALGKAEGFTAKSAKKKIFLIRRGEQEPSQVININNLLTKGDKSQNVVLNEGDCLYLTSNHKIDFARDVGPILYGIAAIGNMNN